MEVTIKVTQDHINEGLINNPKCCPIALAFKEQASGCISTSVEKLILEWEDDNHKKYAAMLPADALKFVSDFDNGIDVNPFEFEINYRKKPQISH